MKISTELFTRKQGEIEHSVLIVEDLYAVTYEGDHICLRTDTPQRVTNQYKLCLYTNANIAAKKMRELNKQYNTNGFRVDRIETTKVVMQDRYVPDQSYDRTVFEKGNQGWQIVTN